MKKRTKILVVVAVIIAACIGLILLLTGNRETYRNIKVQELNGEAEVNRDREEMNAYQGMNLQGGDRVEVQRSSDMKLKLDEDKYVCAMELTRFTLKAVGKETAEKIRICLDEGQVLIDIRKKLEWGESFQVETNNAVMAVRGTTFYVNSYTDAYGENITELSVLDGKITVDSYDGKEIAEVSAGTKIIVVGDENPAVVEQEFNVGNLPEEILIRVEQLLAEQAEKEATRDEQDEPEEDEYPTPTPLEGEKQSGNLKYIIEEDYCVIVGLVDRAVDAVVIPQEIAGYPVKQIRQWAFEQCKFSSMELPEGLQIIKGDAFFYCENLKEITIPDSVQYIGHEAFNGCESLRVINLPEHITDMDGLVFRGTPWLEEQPRQNGMVIINTTLQDASMAEGDVIIPEGVISTNFAFLWNQNVKSVTVPGTVYMLDEGTFSDCHELESVTLQEGVTGIGWQVFENCTSLKELRIPNSLQTVYQNMFVGCSIDNITVICSKDCAVIDELKEFGISKFKYVD